MSSTPPDGSEKPDHSDLVLAVDVGTSETKAALIRPGKLVDATSATYGVHYPRPNWAEQDPADVEQAITSTIRVLAQRQSTLVPTLRGLVFTTQMSGVMPIDAGGRPLRPMMTWLDTRAADLARDEMFAGRVRVKGFGLRKLLKFLRVTKGAPGLNGKDPLCKIYWLKRHEPETYAETYKFVDTHDYAVYLATGQPVTSVDFAFIWWLLDVRKGRFAWSEDLCEAFGLDVTKLCEVRPSTATVGPVTPDFARATGLPADLPVINGAGDLLTSAIGSGAIETGQLHVNVGTAGWVGCHFPEPTKDIPHYVGTILSGIPGTYLILSKQETLGGALDWFKRVLYPLDAENAPGATSKDTSKDTSTDAPTDAEIYREIDALVADSPPGARDLLFTPWLFGERSPINSSHVRGQFFNLGLYHGRGDLLRAIFEGVGFNLRWGAEIVEKLSKRPQDELRVIGGASKSDTWCQVLADVLQKRVVRVQHPQQASAFGAAYIAMVALGILPDFQHVPAITGVDRVFQPDPATRPVYDKLYAEYTGLYALQKKVFRRLNQAA